MKPSGASEHIAGNIGVDALFPDHYDDSHNYHTCYGGLAGMIDYMAAKNKRSTGASEHIACNIGVDALIPVHYVYV